MIRRTIGLALAAAWLAGCDTTDRRMGLATAHDMAVQRAAAQAPAVPREGGSAARGVGSLQRYLTGKVREPSIGPAETLTESVPQQAPK